MQRLLRIFIAITVLLAQAAPAAASLACLSTGGDHAGAAVSLQAPGMPYHHSPGAPAHRCTRAPICASSLWSVPPGPAAEPLLCPVTTVAPPAARLVLMGEPPTPPVPPPNI